MLRAALDTSSSCASFAVEDSETGAFLIEADDLAMGRESALLMKGILERLSSASVDLSDIRSWSVGMGPGSFTGIRVGAAMVTGICTASGADLRGIPSAAAMALDSNLEGSIHVLHDGRRGEALVTRYIRNQAALEDDGKETTVETLSDYIDARSPDTQTVILAADAERMGLSDQTVILHGVKARHLLSASLSSLIQDSLDPVYVRPAVFVEPYFPRSNSILMPEGA